MSYPDVMAKSPSLRQLVRAGATPADIEAADAAVSAMRTRQVTAELLSRGLSAGGRAEDRAYRLTCVIAMESAAERSTLGVSA
jgi:hypothetical protein